MPINIPGGSGGGGGGTIPSTTALLKGDGSGNAVAASANGMDYSRTIQDAEFGSNITPIGDGTYTVGIGVTQNGTITTQAGVVTSVQQAS